MTGLDSILFLVAMFAVFMAVCGLTIKYGLKGDAGDDA